MQYYEPNFKHLNKVVVKKLFKNCSMYVHGSNLGFLWQSHLGHCSLDLNKIGNEH